MAAVSLFWNTNLAAVTSCENAIYPLIFGYFLLDTCTNNLKCEISSFDPFEHLLVLITSKNTEF